MKYLFILAALMVATTPAMAQRQIGQGGPGAFGQGGPGVFGQGGPGIYVPVDDLAEDVVVPEIQQDLGENK